MIGTSNGLSQKTVRPEQNNEIIFQVPRGLYKNGILVLNGEIIQNKERLWIAFTSGAVNSHKKILSYIIFDFVGDEITVANDENGSLVVKQTIKDLSRISDDFYTGSNFKFHMKFKYNEQGGLSVAPMIGGYGFLDIPLLSETDLQENIFLSISEDTLKITNLDFVWDGKKPDRQ